MLIDIRVSARAALRSASKAFKDDAVKTRVARSRAPIGRCPAKVLFDRLLACILEVEQRARLRGSRCCGTTAVRGPAPQPGWTVAVAAGLEPVAVIRRSQASRRRSLQFNARAGIGLPSSAGHARVL